MTRTACMIKLLRHGALSFNECIEITGWPEQSVKNTLRELRRIKRINLTGGRTGQYHLGSVPL